MGNLLQIKCNFTRSLKETKFPIHIAICARAILMETMFQWLGMKLTCEANFLWKTKVKFIPKMPEIAVAFGRLCWMWLAKAKLCLFLSNISLYYLSLFRVPRGWLRSWRGWWGTFYGRGVVRRRGTILWVWNLCCRPGEESGLGLDNVVSKNISLLGKWLWRFPLDNFISKLGCSRNRWDAIVDLNTSSLSPWKAISQASPLFLPLVRLKVGAGDKIALWEDHWIGDFSFSILLPRLVSFVLCAFRPHCWLSL